MELHCVYSHRFWIFQATLLVCFLGWAAAYRPNPWCNSTMVCEDSSNLHLCVANGSGQVNPWKRHITCPQYTLCNATRCVELHSAPFTNGRSACNVYGFSCVSRKEFAICKFDQYNNSVPFMYNFICPNNTVCDVHNPHFCSQEPYRQNNTSSLYPVQPPYNPSFHPSAPVYPGHSSYPPVTKDECKGRGFICIDSTSYLMCENKGDGTIRPYGQQLTCPGKQICQKNFDRPCAVASANHHKSNAIALSGLEMKIIILFMSVCMII